jgi:hypothetical protein
LVKSRLLPASLLSIFVLANLFLWTYLPQVAFLAIFHGRAAWFNGTVLVLGESAAVTALLFEAFFVDETQVDIFDSVLVERGHADLVSVSRPVLPETVYDAPEAPGQPANAVMKLTPRARLGKPTHSAVFAPFSLRQIVEFIVFLPINLVPWVGVPVFLLLTGYRAGPLMHWRYFKLKGFDRKRRNEFIKQRQWMYTWFVRFWDLGDGLVVTDVALGLVR